MDKKTKKYVETGAALGGAIGFLGGLQGDNLQSKLVGGTSGAIMGSLAGGITGYAVKKGVDALESFEKLGGQNGRNRKLSKKTKKSFI